MHGKYIEFLKLWLNMYNRPPLLIGGARHVGKTWLVRQFAKLQSKELIELNLEQDPNLRACFLRDSPKKILDSIAEAVGRTITPSRSILFIDELYTCAPEVLGDLPWIANEIPDLAIIAADSLSTFLQERYFKETSSYGGFKQMYVRPLLFEEFLLAQSEKALAMMVKCFDWEENIDPAVHNKLMDLFREYVIVGGMPAVVKSWLADG